MTTKPTDKFQTDTITPLTRTQLRDRLCTYLVSAKEHSFYLQSQALVEDSFNKWSEVSDDISAILSKIAPKGNGVASYKKRHPKK